MSQPRYVKCKFCDNWAEVNDSEAGERVRRRFLEATGERYVYAHCFLCHCSSASRDLPVPGVDGGPPKS